MVSAYQERSATRTSRILVLLPSGRNRELLTDWLASNERYAVTTDPDQVPPADVDLCLVSDASLDRVADRVRTCKRRQHPTYVPCLLIDRSGEGRMPEGADVVDELIVSPIRKAELDRRLRSLLKARSLSLTLADSMRQYERLVELLPAGVVLLRDETVEYANRAADGMLGVADMEGESLLAFVDEDDRDRVREFLDGVSTEPDREPLVATLHGGDEALTVELSAVRVTFRDRSATQVLLRDVTEREEREERLRLYRRAMDEAKVGITITDPSLPDNPLVYANDRFLELTGYPESAVLGRNCRFLQCEDTDEETVAKIRRAIDEERPVSVEILNERADGTRFMNHLDISPVYGEEGVTHFLGFQRDVTERHQRHSEVLQTRNRLRSTLRRISDAFFSVDTEWCFTYVNERAEELLERNAADLVGENVWEAFPEATERQFYDEYHRAMETGETVKFEEYFPPLGRWYEVTAYADDSGLSVYFRDVTERKERERELERYETIVTTAGDPIFTLSADGRFNSVNEAMVDLTGYDRERLLGAPLSLVCSERDARAYTDVASRLDPGDCEDTGVGLTITSAAGTKHLCEVSVALLAGDGETTSETVGVVHDLTELHRREQHLAVLDRVLRHNLRNKMNVVIGRTEALREDAPDAVAEHADAIAETAGELLGISETARAFQNAVSEGVDMRPRDVSGPIRAALADCERAHDDVECIDDLPDSLWVRAHESVDMAFAELLENAAEHGVDDDGRTIRVAAERETVDGQEWVTVSVADRGPGLPAGEGVALTRETETALEHGTGLGLWVVRWSVERSGGEVWTEENDPRGTVVKVRLRAADPPEE